MAHAKPSADLGLQSLARLREIVLSGGFSSLAAVDPQTGEVADPDARALFASLPAVNPATTPDELVSRGLIGAIPAGLSGAVDSPKYRLDREVFVRTSVSHESARQALPVGAFDPAGLQAFTHRAVLKAKRGHDFLVQLEGAPSLLPFAKTDIFAWNEPRGVAATGGTISGVQVDYNEPRFKAQICAAYLELADDIVALDFSSPEAMARQQDLIYRLAERTRMHYPGRQGGYLGSKVGSLFDGGQGVCYVQRTVAGAFLQVFARILAFDVQFAVGRTLRLGVSHGFVIVTTRPSLHRYVCDPAWGEPLTDLRVAFFGPRWGHDRRLEDFEGEQYLVVRPSDVSDDLPEVGEEAAP